MKVSQLLIIVISIFSFAATAWALDIDAAKNDGLVGESKSGYIAAVSANPSQDVATLVDTVNAKRKQKYVAIAKKRNVPLKSVEQLAAKKAYEKSRLGHFVQDDSGNWKKK